MNEKIILAGLLSDYHTYKYTILASPFMSL
jgi:hypothetical protein